MGSWKCEVNQITKRIYWLRDARSFATGCKKGACQSDKAIASELKEDKCGVDSNAIAWVAPASADGRKRNTMNLSGKYSYSMGEYACTRKCARVTMATYSGWFPIVVTATGAATLAASAAVATGALMF